MEKINTRTLKQQLTLGDCEKILTDLTIPIYSKGDKTWRLYTGCHHKDAYKGGHNLIFYTDTKSFQCVTQCSCSFDIIGLTQRRLKTLEKPCSFMDAIGFIAKSTGKEVGDYKRISKQPNICDWSGLERFVRMRKGDSLLKTFDPCILNELESSYYEGWIDEGISIETQKKFGIKYYRRTNQICIPCRNREGELIGIRCRNLDPERLETAKYIPLITLDGQSYAFPTNQVFYGINYTWEAIERTQTVTIVESEKATMKLDTWYGENNNALGMFGHNLGLKRRNQLIKMGVKRVIYVPDNDWIGKSPEDFDRGKKEVKGFIDSWSGYAQVEIVWDTLDILQPKENAVDQSKEVWEELFNNREIC